MAPLKTGSVKAMMLQLTVLAAITIQRAWRLHKEQQATYEKMQNPSKEQQMQNPDEVLELFIKPGNCYLEPIPVFVKRSELVKVIVEQITHKTGLSQDHFLLVYQQKRMDVNFTAGAFYLEDGATIHLVLKGLAGGGKRGRLAEDNEPQQNIVMMVPEPMDDDIKVVQECLKHKDINFQQWLYGLEIQELEVLKQSIDSNISTGKIVSYVRPYLNSHPDFAALQAVKKRVDLFAELHGGNHGKQL